MTKKPVVKKKRKKMKLEDGNPRGVCGYRPNGNGTRIEVTRRNRD